MADPDRADAARRFRIEHAHYAEDLPFWRALAERHGGPVLDVGAATGRVALDLAAAGHEVWALDADPAMLSELAATLALGPRDVAERVRLVEGDMRDISLSRAFPLIIMAMNTFQVLLTPGDHLACLAAARRHLAPGGALAFDVALPDLGEVQATLGVLRSTGVHRDPSGTTLFHSAAYEAFDPVGQTLEFTLFVDERGPDGTLARHARPHRVHLFLPAEVRHLLARAGLVVEAAHGGFDGRPLEGGAERQVYVCRAGGEAG